MVVDKKNGGNCIKITLYEEHKNKHFRALNLELAPSPLIVMDRIFII